MTYRWNLAHFIIETFHLTGAGSAAVIGVGLLLCMVIPYLLGSINFGLIISRKKYNDDIRQHGSGNAGTTNMLRTYGTKAAVLTLLGDMAKGALAVLIGYLLVNFEVKVYSDTGAYLGLIGDKPGAAIAGLFVMLGHMFPCFFKFKGGKGVATTAMVILMLNPLVFAILLAVFVVIVAFTRYVSLGSVMSVCLYPVILSAFEQSKASFSASGAAVIMAIFVVYMHRSNIARLKEGKESKLSFKKKKGTEASETEAPAPNKKTRQKQKHEAEVAAEAELDRYEYVQCTGCGSLIPRSRKVCAYCNTPNQEYAPDPAAEKASAGKKDKKQRK